MAGATRNGNQVGVAGGAAAELEARTLARPHATWFRVCVFQRLMAESLRCSQLHVFCPPESLAPCSRITRRIRQDSRQGICRLIPVHSDRRIPYRWPVGLGISEAGPSGRNNSEEHSTICAAIELLCSSRRSLGLRLGMRHVKSCSKVYQISFSLCWCYSNSSLQPLASRSQPFCNCGLERIRIAAAKLET